MKTAQFATLCFTCLLGIMPVAASAQPYTISTDGSEVTDQKTGLIWLRCAEGMVLNSHTCTGAASTFTHETAEQRAADHASNTGIAWRLPNIKELASIADKNRINPAIDSTAFPATPASKFWSASPCVSHPGGVSYPGGSHPDGHPSSYWFVHFLDGHVSDDYDHRSNHVRLVRDGQ